MSDLSPTFGFLLHDAARLLRRDFDRRARDLGLTRAQYSVLFHLNRNEGCNQISMADVLEVQPITLARQLDRLEEAGWIERRPDPQDRRARRLYLTDKVRPVLAELARIATETRELALTGLNSTERETLQRLLLQVRANLCYCSATAETALSEE